ncbi:MAG TPA: hypothetical protein VMY37_07295 [Thermoguttaceae bacterium]|nr:hypothetical protein [Thermoguttaceae bacterium]
MQIKLEKVSTRVGRTSSVLAVHAEERFMAKRSIVGDLINYRGFVYGPVNEMGVVALFAKLSEEMGFIIEEVRPQFPDCIARRQVDKGWERVAIEFEFKSSNFHQHGHDPDACDLIVCWEHDWEGCPVPVLALKPCVADAQANVSAPLRRVRIADPLQIRRTTLSEGGVRNSYINIKPLDEFWPEECVGGNVDPAAKHLIVEFEGVGRVTTDISGRHKTFRKTHREVKEFFRSHGLKPGDQVEILRVAKYEYRVRPAEAASE